MPAKTIPVSPFSLVVFGATGDLARRKLFPALWRRLAAGQAPGESCLVGAAREELSDESFRQLVAEAVVADSPAAKNEPQFADWLNRCAYVAMDAADSAQNKNWQPLQNALENSPAPRLYYLALAPALVADVCARCADNGFLAGGGRLVLEKPFGRNLTEARALNKTLAAIAPEKNIYRIDHYLGKETVQNLMALRFANSMWEPAWNARAIDHVQITVAEQIGAAGRGGYYDSSGATRDMLQNHLLQLLCLTAMEPPPRYNADEVRDQKLKVLKSLRPLDENALESCAAFGQYAAGNGLPSYADDIGGGGGGGESQTETFVAVKCMVDNWRWAGAPFYLRTGKRLAARVSEIAVRFKDPPHSIFPSMSKIGGNTLAIRLQPQECITLQVNIKEPGPGGFRITCAPLDMSFAKTLDAPLPDAYERLLMDVVRGDQTLFMRADELEAAWEWAMPLVQYAEENAPAAYACGGAGPDNARRLMEADNRAWREIV